ncbi:MAG TPA: ATP-binding protein [Bryobacteraceae bacterium]|nr:ATP-binding protein [Bryobacteraceae bacterium]
MLVEKSAEGAISALARTLDQSLILIEDWDGIIEHWTSGCQHLYGWSADEAIGKFADDLLQTLPRDSFDSIRHHLRATGTWQGEIQQTAKDGTSIFVLTRCVMLSENQDRRPSIVSTYTDLTGSFKIQRELEIANERLRTMALELESSNAELEEFARIASHDLSAPLVSTRWLLDLFYSRYGSDLDEEGQSSIQEIIQSLERMTNLTEAILEHALVGTGAIHANEASDAEAALSFALANLQKELNLSGAVIKRGALPKLFIAAQPLAQVFQNLVSNAVKYRRSDTPLRIDLTATFQAPDWLIMVEDNGLGIEASWLERIFQPLQRRYGSEISGSGIGLATCRKIVTRAGGKIWVESELGRGSKFCFTLRGPVH